MSNNNFLKDIEIVPENMTIQAIIDHLGSDTCMLRQRPYNGQSHTTDGIRGSEVVKDLTFRDLKDCFIRAFILSHSVFSNDGCEYVQPNKTLSDECEKRENAAICVNDIYTLVGEVDPMAIWQNMACEIEKIMGIYPNIKDLLKDET